MSIIPSETKSPERRKAFHQEKPAYLASEWLKVSIIIPTFNCAQTIALTIESLLEQDYPNFEIIVVDGGSKDRTLELVKAFRQDQIRIYSLPIAQRYEMLNKGISHALGRYINCLFPGDFYISRFTLQQMMSLAIEKNQPHLVYCGTLLRDGKSQVKSLYRSLNIELLKNGQQPTSLQSCWFRIDAFRELGKFNAKYHVRGGFDLLCRYMMHPEFRTESIHRILTDYDLRWVSRSMILQHFWETCVTIWRYYGAVATIQWLFRQKDALRFIKLWWRNIRIAFFRSEKKF